MHTFTVIFLIYTNILNASEDIQTIQKRLNYLGFSMGMPDGVVGEKTLSALSQLYKANGFSFDGNISHQVTNYAHNEMQERKISFNQISEIEKNLLVSFLIPVWNLTNTLP